MSAGRTPRQGIKCFESGQYNLLAGELRSEQDTNATHQTLCSIYTTIKRCTLHNDEINRKKTTKSTNRLFSVSKITIINSRDTRSYVLSTAQHHTHKKKRRKRAYTRRCGFSSAVRSISFFYLLLLFSFLFVSRRCCGCCYCCCLLLHIIFSERIYFLGNLNKRLAEELSEAEKNVNERANRQHREKSLVRNLLPFQWDSHAHDGIARRMCVEPKKMATDKELCSCRRDEGITQDTTSKKKKQAKNAEYKHSTERFYLLV